MIKIENLSLELSKSFRLSIDRFIVEEGKVLAMIGPNGAGKTTFLNVMAMFDRPDSGHIEMFGENILNRSSNLSLRRQTSIVFSKPYLLSQTVYNNVSLPLRLRRHRDAAYVEQTLELFKISHLRNRNAAALSQGEKHRVALARAFVTRPKLVLLDEPFLSLDSRYKESLISDLRSMMKLNGITTIFVTQDQTEALSLSHTMAVMMGGKILQQGRPEEIFTRPASKEIADFVGVETIIEGHITKKDDNLCFIQAGNLLFEAISKYDIGDRVFVCFRPEDVVISRRIESNSARNHIKAVITSIEAWRLGYQLNLHCGFNLAAAVTKQSIEDLDLKVGREIFLSLKATAVHLIKR